MFALLAEMSGKKWHVRIMATFWNKKTSQGTGWPNWSRTDRINIQSQSCKNDRWYSVYFRVSGETLTSVLRLADCRPRFGHGEPLARCYQNGLGHLLGGSLKSILICQSHDGLGIFGTYRVSVETLGWCICSRCIFLVFTFLGGTEASLRKYE